MKYILNKIYHRYFPEIMTGILVSLLLITGLLIYGIWNGTNQRNKINESTSEKLDSLQAGQSKITNVVISKSDSIQDSLIKKLDNINNKQ